MANYYFSQLPDDILCWIFSFLTLRDAVRSRSLTSSWRYLPDTRSVLQFDTFSVFGKETRYLITSDNIAYQSKFVEIVDRFLLELWRVSHLLEDSEKKTSCLKRICLKYCRIVPSLSPLMCKKSWLSRLTTLELSYVPLHQSGAECILSSCGLHLVSLSLIRCCLRTFCITGQLVCLKKLVVEDNLKLFKLDGPSLQEFEYRGLVRKMTFDHVPKLRKAVLWFGFMIGGNSVIFDELTRKAPRLEALTLTIRTEVQPLPVGIIRARLRKLVLRALIPYGFDTLTFTYMLHASLFLEILDIELRPSGGFRRSSGSRRYSNRHIFRLKEVKFSTISYPFMELALYLVRHAMVLKQMVIECPRPSSSVSNRLMQNRYNPEAQVIVQHMKR